MFSLMGAWLFRALTVVVVHCGMQGIPASHSALRQPSQLLISPITWAMDSGAAGRVSSTHLYELSMDVTILAG
jgi:hypothetical protein